MKTLGLMTRSGLALAFLLTAVGCGDDTQTGLDAGNDSGVTACMGNEECPEGQFCDLNDNTCKMPVECTMDEECGDGRICDNGSCAPRACTTSEVCGAWVCIDDVCAQPPSCAGGAACPGTLTCSPTTEVCVETTSCTDDAECTVAGEICVSGVCAADVACTESSECPSSLRCIEGSCREPCAQASDCGQQILWTCESGECLQNCLGDDNCDDGLICEERPAAASVCVAAECTGDPDCDQGAGERCNGVPHGRCIVPIACTDDGDCDPNFFCNSIMECEELPTCARDADCGSAGYCEEGHCQQTESCAVMSCPGGFDCVAEVCVPAVCRTDADCSTAGEVCLAGACTAAPSPAVVTEVRILTPAGFVVPTSTYQFRAIALDTSGNIVPGVTFVWESSDTDVASIAATGEATGGTNAGTTSITAGVDTGSGVITSPGVDLTNLGAVAQGRRVTVANAYTGAPIQGATVTYLSTQGQSFNQTTNAAGLAEFNQTFDPASVTITDANSDWVTLIGVTGSDLFVPLTPASRKSETAGVRGPVDLSQIMSMSPVQVALSGGSFAGPINRFGAAGIFGGDLFTVSLMVTEVDLPSGITAAAEVFGFPVNIKDTYYSRTKPGLRMPWSFGGRVELADIGIGGGGGGGFLSGLLARFQTFKHGLAAPAVTLSLPFIQDSADINGNGDTQEMVPDFNNFTSAPLQPSVEQTLRYQIAAGAQLPSFTDSMMVIAGVMQPGIGFIPLGVDGAQDSGTGVPSFVTRIAPPHSGAEGGTYVVLALALPLQSGIPNFTSARMVVADSLPTQVDLSGGWMELPSGSFNEQTRTLTSSASAGADAWRARFEHEDGLWEVYGPAGVETFELPAVTGTDRSANAGIVLDALDFDANVTIDTLFDVSAHTDPMSMDRATIGFSQNPILIR